MNEDDYTVTTVIQQGTKQWHEARRAGISSTDIPIILGLSPYASEADLARKKGGEVEDEPNADSARRMRLGLAMEEIVAAEDEIEHGFALGHVDELIVHPTIEWAITSLDYERETERTIVEIKTSRAGKWEYGLPLDVEAQVRWQMGVAGYPRAHVAVLRSGSDLVCFDVEHDQAQFDGLVTVAQDFRERLAAGGPFAENAASIKRTMRRDDGSEIEADDEITEAAHTLLAIIAEETRLGERREQVELALKQRIGAVAHVIGKDFSIWWKQSKGRPVTSWAKAGPLLADALGEAGNEIVAQHTSEVEGPRPFRVSTKRGD